MTAPDEVRLLRRLAAPGVRILRTGPDRWTAFPHGDRRRRPVARLDDSQLRSLTASGALAAQGEDRILSAEGRARLARLRDGGADAHAAAHRQVETRTVETADGKHAVQVNLSESPLARLARPDPETGQAFFTAPEIEAGERLRALLTRSTLNPRLTMDWSAPPAGRSGARGVRDPAGAPDSALAARDRVNGALDYVGSPLSSVLLDILWNENSLTAVEERQAWPRRSGKLALKLALGRLALHFGLTSS